MAACQLGRCALTCVEFTQSMGLGLIACRAAISGNMTSIRNLLFVTADDVRRSTADLGFHPDAVVFMVGS